MNAQSGPLTPNQAPFLQTSSPYAKPVLLTPRRGIYDFNCLVSHEYQRRCCRRAYSLTRSLAYSLSLASHGENRERNGEIGKGWLIISDCPLCLVVNKVLYKKNDYIKAKSRVAKEVDDHILFPHIPRRTGQFFHDWLLYLSF